MEQRNPLHHFEEFNKEIIEVCEREHLFALNQIKDGNQHINNELSVVMGIKKSINPLPYSHFKIQDEMTFITRDIRYVVGVLFFLRPYIVNTDESGGRYNQNMPDRRYTMYASFGIEASYNFWDRIGDVLHLYFETGLPVDNVYLKRVLNNIKPMYKATPEYEALNELFKTKVEPFLEDRHDVVHYYQLETKYYHGAIQYRGNQSELKKLNAEKHGLPEKLKEHLELCIEGFRLTVALLNLLPDDPEVVALRAQATQSPTPPAPVPPAPSTDTQQ